MNATYNEHDPYAAQWLRNLVERSCIEPGVVDERDIRELTPADCLARSHFFAGIGGWPLALALAGWPEDVPVWTGSCPCQPFSTAGRRKGADDARHLWPAWCTLIAECQPAVIFGEQVASRDGRLWLDAVSSDLETLGYAVAAADLCAAGVGAPHIRQRLYWVAHRGGQRQQELGVQLQPGQPRQAGIETTGGGAAGGVADATSWAGSERLRREPETDSRRIHTRTPRQRDAQEGATHGVGGAVLGAQASGDPEWFDARRLSDELVTAGATRGAWSDAEWWLCTDGKARPAQPGAFPLVNGAPNRVGRLRAYGNAIVPQVAAAFVRAAMGAIPQLRSDG